MKKLLLPLAAAVVSLIPFSSAEAHQDCYKQSLGIPGSWTWVCKPHIHTPSGGGSSDSNLGGGGGLVTPPPGETSVQLKVYNWTSHNIYMRQGKGYSWKTVRPGDYKYMTVRINAWGNTKTNVRIENKSGSKWTGLGNIPKGYRYDGASLYITRHYSSSRHLDYHFSKNTALKYKSSSLNLNNSSSSSSNSSIPKTKIRIVNDRSTTSYYKIGNSSKVYSLSPGYYREHYIRAGYKSGRIWIKQSDGAYKFCTTQDAKTYKKVKIKYFKNSKSRGCYWYSVR